MVKELAEPFAMSLPAVSKHLKVLERAGLVSRTVDGRMHRCSFAPEPLQQAEQWISRYRAFWENTGRTLRLHQTRQEATDRELMDTEEITLVVRRTIQATPEELFAAWTEPEQLKKWWGPRPVVCAEAEVDLWVGGSYRIANRLADGTLLWISGEFELIDPPFKLVYTWRIGPASQTLRASHCRV